MEQLEICANEFVSSSMPRHAAHQGFADAYTGSSEYAKGVVGQLSGLIHHVGIDRFSQRELESSKTKAPTLFADDQDPWSVLWLNRLVGFVEDEGNTERHIFYSEDSVDRFHLPQDKVTYVFHPIILDAIAIRPVGSVPVNPFKTGGYS